MSVLKYKAIKFDHNSSSETRDYLMLEAPLSISVNGEAFTVTMRSPGNDEDLIRGLLFNEDVYKHKNHEPEISILEKDKLDFPSKINVQFDPKLTGAGYLNKRSLMSVASCGICGITEFEPHHASQTKSSNTYSLLSETVLGFFEKMSKVQHAFHQSGGAHAAAAFDKQGEMLFVREDIGRHNAVDKVVGALLREKKLSDAICLIVSGRISYEIVSKCFMAGIPFLAAVSSPSSMAVDYSKELGITLMAFCRNDRISIYSHPERIEGIEKIIVH